MADGDNPYYVDHRSNPTGSSADISDFDRAWEDVPVLGWLTGADARADAARAEHEQRINRGMWAELAGVAPSAEDLSVDYQQLGTGDEYGDLIGDPSQFADFGASGDQEAALAALRSLYESGGYTDADRQFANQQRAMRAQQIGAQNRAALAAQEARGTGGGGLGFAAATGGGQSLANANAMGDASVQQAAMQRAMQALYGYQGQANTMQSQEMARRQALDAFNQRNMDWRRSRSAANTGIYNRQQDQNTSARQTAYGNQERAVAGSTNQYTAGTGERLANQQRTDQANAAAAAGIGSLIEDIL